MAVAVRCGVAARRQPPQAPAATAFAATPKRPWPKKDLKKFKEFEFDNAQKTSPLCVAYLRSKEFVKFSIIVSPLAIIVNS